MSDASPFPPPDFSNPYEAKIIELEKKYSQGIAEGKMFAEMKQLRNEIGILKSELSLQRKTMNNEMNN